MTNATRPIGIYCEHQDWFGPLFDELDRRGTRYVRHCPFIEALETHPDR